MPGLNTLFKKALKAAIASHYKRLVAEVADIYGYSLFTDDGLSGLGPVANRESALKKQTTEPKYNYYRYLAVAWSEWNDFGMFADVNALLRRMHDEAPAELGCVLPTCLDVLIELEAEGVFGARMDSRFIVICLCDSDDEIMMESAKRLNTEHAFTAYAGEFSPRSSESSKSRLSIRSSRRVVPRDWNYQTSQVKSVAEIDSQSSRKTMRPSNENLGAPKTFLHTVLLAEDASKMAERILKIRSGGPEKELYDEKLDDDELEKLGPHENFSLYRLAQTLMEIPCVYLRQSGLNALEFMLTGPSQSIQTSETIDFEGATRIRIDLLDLTAYLDDAIVQSADTPNWLSWTTHNETTELLGELGLFVKQSRDVGKHVYLMRGALSEFETVRQRPSQLLASFLVSLKKGAAVNEDLAIRLHGVKPFLAGSAYSYFARNAVNALLSSQQSDTAERLTAQLLEELPNHLFPYVCRAQILSEKFQHKQIVEEFSELLQLRDVCDGKKPQLLSIWYSAEIFEAYYQLAKALYEVRRLEEALEVLQLFDNSKRYFRTASICNLSGMSYFRLEKYESAEIEFRNALDISGAKELHFPHENLGRTLAKLHRYEEAIAHFTSSLALHGNNAWGYRNRALAYEKLGMLDKAEIDWRNCVQQGGRRPRR